MPAHIAMPDGYTYPAWITKVIQRKAPGAISAMALTVTPVKPSVAFILGASGDPAIFPPITPPIRSQSFPPGAHGARASQQTRCHRKRDGKRAYERVEVPAPQAFAHSMVIKRSP